MLHAPSMPQFASHADLSLTFVFLQTTPQPGFLSLLIFWVAQQEVHPTHVLQWPEQTQSRLEPARAHDVEGGQSPIDDSWNVAMANMIQNASFRIATPRELDSRSIQRATVPVQE